MPEHATSPSSATEEVLARIPDVDAVDTIPFAGKQSGRTDGRLLSQGASAKLLLAGAVFLLLAATLPFLFSNQGADKAADAGSPASQPSPPPPTAQATPPRSDGVVQAPKRQSGASKRSRPAGAKTAPEADRPPQAVPNRPVAIGEPGDNPSEHRTDYRPEYRDDPRAGYPQYPSTDDRRDALTDPQADSRSGRSASLADRRIEVPTAPPGSETQSPPEQPGVARFEGIIEQPPVRTTYDRARPGLH